MKPNLKVCEHCQEMSKRVDREFTTIRCKKIRSDNDYGYGITWPPSKSEYRIADIYNMTERVIFYPRFEIPEACPYVLEHTITPIESNFKFRVVKEPDGKD